MNKEKYFEKHAILKTAEGFEINFIPFVSNLRADVMRYFYEIGVIFDSLAAKRGLPNFVKDKDRKIIDCLKDYAHALGIDGYCSHRDYIMIRDCSWGFDIPVRAAVYMWGYYRHDLYQMLELRRLILGIKGCECVLRKGEDKCDIFSAVSSEEISEQAEEQEVK